MVNEYLSERRVLLGFNAWYTNAGLGPDISRCKRLLNDVLGAICKMGSYNPRFHLLDSMAENMRHLSCTWSVR